MTRAKKTGLPFDIAESDIVVPKYCPILGIELHIGTRDNRDASPSLDRLKPELGYVRGNIHVISNRANRLKTDGTIEEHQALVRWLLAQ